MQPNAQQPNIQYEKYRAPLKKHCLIEAIAAGVAIVTLIFLFFLPNFSIDLTDKTFLTMKGTTLPKLYDLGILFSGDTSISFSIFDEFYAIVSPVQTDDTVMTVGMSFEFMQIIGLIFLAIGLAMSAVSAVKAVLHLVKSDEYALEMYDTLKTRDKLLGKSWLRFANSPMYFLIVGIVWEVVSVILASSIGRMAGTDAYITSYFSVMSGITASGIITILFGIATIVLFIVSNHMLKKVSFDIMKEDYGVNMQTMTAPQTVPAPQNAPQPPYFYISNGQPQPPYGYYAPPAGAPNTTASPAAPQAGAPDTTGSSASGQTTPPQNPTDGNK